MVEVHILALINPAVEHLCNFAARDITTSYTASFTQANIKDVV